MHSVPSVLAFTTLTAGTVTVAVCLLGGFVARRLAARRTAASAG